MYNSTRFSGPMKTKIQEYMHFRKSLGFSIRNTAYIYGEFDRFLKNNYPHVKIITREMVIG